VAFVILALSGCLKPPESGISVKAVNADLVFGVPPLPEPVAPPTFEDVEPVDEGPSPRPTRTDSTPIIRPPTPNIECPTASDRTFPEEEAPTTVRDISAKEGLYTWKYTRTSRNQQGVTQTVSTFTGKSLFNMRKTGAKNHEFSVGEFAERGGSVVATVQDFRVIQNGDDNDGIFLTRITTFRNAEDRQGTSFTPEPAILFLPIPVRAGLTLGDANAGVDGGTLAVLRQSGTVTGRKRIDVCGTVIDSWFVDAQQQYTAPGGSSYEINYDYAVVPQFGGFVGLEVIGSTQPFYTIDQNIGGLEPTGPVPGRFQ
jgi:hypothetical protein